MLKKILKFIGFGILDYFNSNGSFDESAWKQSEIKMSYSCN